MDSLTNFGKKLLLNKKKITRRKKKNIKYDTYISSDKEMNIMNDKYDKYFVKNKENNLDNIKTLLDNKNIDLKNIANIERMLYSDEIIYNRDLNTPVLQKKGYNQSFENNKKKESNIINNNFKKEYIITDNLKKEKENKNLLNTTTMINDNLNDLPLDNLKSDLEYMEKNSLLTKNIWGDKDWNNILKFPNSEKTDEELNIININNRINKNEDITIPHEEIQVNDEENITGNSTNSLNSLNSLNSKINFNNSALSLNISKIKNEIEEKNTEQMIVKKKFNEKFQKAMDFHKHKLNFQKKS